jgi:hypothetical protein
MIKCKLELQPRGGLVQIISRYENNCKI